MVLFYHIKFDTSTYIVLKKYIVTPLRGILNKFESNLLFYNDYYRYKIIIIELEFYFSFYIYYDPFRSTVTW